MPFLKQNIHQHFRSQKTITKLDLEPSIDLLSLLKSLVYCNEYLVVQKNNSKLYPDLKKRFEIEIVKTNLIQNSVLHQYIKTFFILSSEKE